MAAHTQTARADGSPTVVGDAASQLSPADRHARYEVAFADLDPPFAFIDLEAMWSNSADLLRRAAGKPIRVASKSLRCRHLLRAILDRDDRYQGLLTYTLPETLWLAGQGFENLVVAYPSTDRRALRELASLTAADPAGAPALMVDCREHLDLIERAMGHGGAPIRVCLDFDASYWLLGGRVKIGPKRTPLHTPAQAQDLAAEIERRPRLTLVGMMAYEGHIAGVGDRVPGKPLKSALVHRMQSASARELRERRARAVAAVSEVTALEFVNGGGTGSLELTASEPAVTEVTAGSGFYAPTLFDNYTAFSLEPAAIFALPVSRRPGRGVVTALGGGYLASGPGGRDRMPTPYLPPGLRMDAMEGAGEVQTPLLGEATGALSVGDRVYFRHTKAGELCERFDSLYLIQGAEIAEQVPTYRGEGHAFL
jgi:D-serine deaminase-like pyridoxal phosphate-dependent protein